MRPRGSRRGGGAHLVVIVRVPTIAVRVPRFGAGGWGGREGEPSSVVLALPRGLNLVAGRTRGIIWLLFTSDLEMMVCVQGMIQAVEVHDKPFQIVGKMSKTVFSLWEVLRLFKALVLFCFEGALPL